MSLESRAIDVLDAWYNGLNRYQDKLPAKGSIAAALHVLHRLQTNFNLDISSHVAGGEAQITGLSLSALNRLLAEFGETRPLAAVAGRTNRGGRGDVKSLLTAMTVLNLKAQAEAARTTVLRAMQRRIVENYVPKFFSAKRVKATFNESSETARLIRIILQNAQNTGKAGAVAEYLVGAKLAIKFPTKEIRNKRSSSADAQSGHEGDFQIGRTIFHVTMVPMPELYPKLKSNRERGFKVLLLVPTSRLAAALENAESDSEHGLGVDGIELFVARNIDELSEFDGGAKLKSGFRKLLETYNERVDRIETDKSMLIEIPPNL